MLILAGGGSYYFAKRSINADRAERAEAEERSRQAHERMRVQEMMMRKSEAADGASSKGSGGRTDPSREAVGGDPAPVTHEQEKVAARGRFEAAEPFRAPKGDRFS